MISRKYLAYTSITYSAWHDVETYTSYLARMPVYVKCELKVDETAPEVYHKVWWVVHEKIKEDEGI